MSRIVVFISGQGTNLQALIDAQIAQTLPADIVLVISDNPSAHGLIRAKNHGIATLCIEPSFFESKLSFEAALSQHLLSAQPDLIVLAGFMRILSAHFVTQYLGKIINIHPSLLPKYRGLNTYARAIANGEQWHGASIHFVTAELDAGPIICQGRIKIHKDESIEQLKDRVQQVERILLPRSVDWIIHKKIMLDSQSLQLINHTNIQASMLETFAF